MNRSAALNRDSISGLHPHSIESRYEIKMILGKAAAQGAILCRGLNHRLDLETATITSIETNTITLLTQGFRRNNRPQIFLNFSVDDRPYFFASSPIGKYNGNELSIELPTVIFSSERRDRLRREPEPEFKSARVESQSGRVLPATIQDISPGGLGISVESRTWDTQWKSVQITYDTREKGTQTSVASVKNSAPLDLNGWTRIGLVESPAKTDQKIQIDRRSSISRPTTRSASDSLKKNGDAEGYLETEVVRFPDSSGNKIVGFLDRSSESTQPVAVLLQTGWGETKEALLPLARTIIETFKNSGEPVAVLRIDGINQRGESYKSPDCRIAGREYNRFGFSQPVRDLEAATTFLNDRCDPKKTILVSQSIAALAGRKFVALDQGSTIDGWICIVGAPDLQSASRSISGGIDFAIGFDNGIEFGYQELLGVMIHADRMMRDAIDVGILYIADAREDFAAIATPVTWFHGQFDAWVELDRIQDIMSHGDLANRKLVTLPIAHRLGWSDTAYETYGLIASEIAEISLGRPLDHVRPDKDSLSRQRAWERKRKPRVETDLRLFWQDYLLGRDESIGIELMTACDPYKTLMADQIEMLDLSPRSVVADLGCGTGSFPVNLLESSSSGKAPTVIGIDHIPAALRRSRNRVDEVEHPGRSSFAWLASNLDVVEGTLAIPLSSGGVDRALASLVISYVERPSVFLAEVFRILRPGGKLVLSSLIKDADISRLYVESLAEHSTNLNGLTTESGAKTLGVAAKNFLNDAARILEMEAEGSFFFWEPAELRTLVQDAGFEVIEDRVTFGYPGQAVVVSCQKPSGVYNGSAA